PRRADPDGARSRLPARVWAMSRFRLPVRWRLALWYAALLAATLLAIGAALFVGMQQRLYADFDDQLATQAATRLASVTVRNGVPSLPADAVASPADQAFIRLLDGTGRVLVDNGAELGGVPLDQGAAAAALAGRTTLALASVGDNELLRIITLPVRRNGDAGDVVGVLQVGLDRQD